MRTRKLKRMLRESFGKVPDPYYYDGDMNYIRAYYSDFQKFISASGMTEEEYWASMEETYRRTITLQYYCAYIQEQYVEEGKPEDDIDQWREYCVQCTQDAIDEQGIELKHKNAWEFSKEDFVYDNYWPHSPVQGGEVSVLHP